MAQISLLCVCLIFGNFIAGTVCYVTPYTTDKTDDDYTHIHISQSTECPVYDYPLYVRVRGGNLKQDEENRASVGKRREFYRITRSSNRQKSSHQPNPQYRITKKSSNRHQRNPEYRITKKSDNPEYRITKKTNPQYRITKKAQQNVDAPKLSLSEFLGSADISNLNLRKKRETSGMTNYADHLITIIANGRICVGGIPMSTTIPGDMDSDSMRKLLDMLAFVAASKCPQETGCIVVP